MPVYLRPLVITRVANAAFPLALVAFGLGTFGLASLPVTVPPAGWFVVRGYRMGVLLDGSEIVVRGFFWSRRIKRTAVREIGLLPSVRWVSNGRNRWTPITAFAELGRVAPFVTKRNEWAIEQLRAWAGRR